MNKRVRRFNRQNIFAARWFWCLLLLSAIAAPATISSVAGNSSKVTANHYLTKLRPRPTQPAGRAEYTPEQLQVLDTFDFQQKITANDGAANDNFGISIAVSGDLAVVGAAGDDSGANADQGAAYVFIRSGATWTQQAKLTANDGAAGDRFGISVDYSADSAIVGANFDDVGANLAQGSAYVFIRGGTTWAQQQKLTAAGGAAGDGFGAAVGLDGNTAAIGAPDRDVAANVNQGAVYTFARSGSAWTEEPITTAGDGAADDGFGTFLSLKGGTLGVGAPFASVGGNAERGAAYMYGVSGPQLSISDVTVTEGNTGLIFAVFTVTLSRPAPSAQFSFATADGTATAGSDYNAFNGSITFINNATTANIVVEVRGETVFEAAENFFVNLSNPTGGIVIADAQGEGTIINDDSQPTFAINDITVNEGNSGTTPATFTLSLSNRSSFPVTVNYATSNGTAQAGTDYQAVSAAQATFAPNVLTQTVAVNVLGDTQIEPDETFFVDLTEANGGVLNDRQGQATIINDDGAVPALQFTAATTTTSETLAAVTLTVQRLGDVTGTVSVDYGTNDNFTFAECGVFDGVARQRCDYVASYGRLTFAPNEASKTITIPIVDDLHFEAPNETFSVTLSNPAGATLGGNATNTITISENDLSALTGTGFMFRLTGAQVVPAVNSNALGFGRATLNTSQNLLTIDLLNIAGSLSSIQFFTSFNGPAQENANGTQLVMLPAGNLSGLTISVSPTQAEQLRKGLLYFSVHTANFPNGELRGHLLANPLESARFFVREQYYDFLNRVPDQAGSDFWTGEIANFCGTDLNCIHRRHIDVSAAFFVELEFQETGAFVFRLYKAAFGEQTAYRPDYSAFVPDRARVVGGANLAQGKLDFANAFAQRAAFTNRYPAGLTPAQFVDALLLTVQQGSGVTFTAAERQSFITDVTNNGRGAMLLSLGDNTAFKNALFNRAFVLMQYFGYLKRDPDQAGYDFWLNTINGQPNNIRGMVCAFVTSAEYQQRFSPVVTRTNADCSAIP